MPEQPYNSDGWRGTGRFRLRQDFWAVKLEEFVEREDGTRYWRQVKYGETFEIHPFARPPK